MPLDITFQRKRVLIDGHDSEGRLVLVDDQLVAVIVRVDGQGHDPEQRGALALGSGVRQVQSFLCTPRFKTPEEAGAWVERTLTREPG